MKKLLALLACLAIAFFGSSVTAAENWFENVQITGYIETQASFTSTDNNSPVDDVDASDIDLTWMDLWVDAQVHENVAGHLRFAWDGTDVDDGKYGNVWLDEGYVKVTGSDDMPVYLLMGRQYVSVGNFTTFFVSDPTTLLLGETREGAAKAGYLFADGTVDVSLGFYNGKVDEFNEEDRIDSFIARIDATIVEGLLVGAAVSSNITASNRLVPDETVDNLVGGYAAWVTWEFLDRMTLIGEYVSAAGDIETVNAAGVTIGEIKPAAWNTEFGYDITDVWNVAVRYGGSKDGGDLMHENEFGGIVNWAIFTNTRLSLQYMHGEYDHAVIDKDDSIKLELALNF